MGKGITVDEILVSIELTAVEPEVFNESEIPGLEITEDNREIFNSSPYYSFELRDYDQWMPEYKVVLEFFDRTGNSIGNTVRD